MDGASSCRCFSHSYLSAPSSLTRASIPHSCVHSSFPPTPACFPVLPIYNLIFSSSTSLSLSFALSAKFDPSFSFHSTFSLFLVFPPEKGLALPPWRLQGSPPPPHLSLPPFFSSPFSLHSTVSSVGNR